LEREVRTADRDLQQLAGQPRQLPGRHYGIDQVSGGPEHLRRAGLARRGRVAGPQRDVVRIFHDPSRMSWPVPSIWTCTPSPVKGARPGTLVTWMVSNGPGDRARRRGILGHLRGQVRTMTSKARCGAEYARAPARETAAVPAGQADYLIMTAARAPSVHNT